jgi:hypothetical protein
MKFAIIAIIVIHALIHVTGFIKAFRPARVTQLSQDIPKSTGVLWLAAAITFILSAVFLAIQTTIWWWIFSLSGVILSQFLIARSWKDAKFGTLANGIILVITIAGIITWYVTK